MAIRINKNRATATACTNCSARTVCASWTFLENNDGIGWRSHGTINLCPACLRTAATETEQTQRKGDLEERIRAAGNTVPSGASFEDVIALALSLGLFTEVEEEPQILEDVAAKLRSQGQMSGLDALLAEARTFNVPVPAEIEESASAIALRIDLWREARALEIDLADEFTNAQASEVIAAAKAARTTPPAPPEDEAKALDELMAGAMPAIIEWVNKAPTAAARNGRAAQALEVERGERKRVTLIAELEKIAAGDETGAASQQPPRGREAPIQGNLVR